MSSNTTLSGANIKSDYEHNQHHGVVQLGQRQHITELYQYGYNLSNTWSFLGVRVYTIMVVIHKKTQIAKKIGPAMRQFFSLCSVASLSSLQKLHRESSSRPQKGFTQKPTEVKIKPQRANPLSWRRLEPFVADCMWDKPVLEEQDSVDSYWNKIKTAPAVYTLSIIVL